MISDYVNIEFRGRALAALRAQLKRSKDRLTNEIIKYNDANESKVDTYRRRLKLFLMRYL